MQSNDALTAYFVKLWPWAEANKNRLIAGGGIVAAAVLVFSFLSWQREQGEIAAGETLTQLTFSVPPNTSGAAVADSFLKIAREHPNTLAGQRAWLRGAEMLFAGGAYTDAQAQFQKFLDAHPDGVLSASAAFGVAASLEAQGKLDQAAGAYQRVINGFTDVAAANAAKFALGRIREQQGNYAEAINAYQDVARTSPGSPLAQEAELRGVELRAKMTTAAAKPATAKP